MSSAEKIDQRATLLLEVGNDLLESGVLPDSELIFRAGRIPLIAKGYFILSETYKRWRMNDGHRTEAPKIAALSALAINRFSPFAPLHPQNVQSRTVEAANQIFAVTYAFGILGRHISPTSAENRDFLQRLFDIVAACPVETLEPFVKDVDMQIVRDVDGYKTLKILPADAPGINATISIFELLSSKVRARRPWWPF